MTLIGYIFLPLIFIIIYFLLEGRFRINLVKFLCFSFVLSLIIQLVFNKIISSLTIVSGTTVLGMLLLVSLIKLLQNPSMFAHRKYLPHILLFFTLVCSYFFVKAIISPASSTSLFKYLYEFRVLFIVYLYTAILMMFSEKEVINSNLLFNVLFWMFVFQVLIGILQLLSLEFSNVFKFEAWVHNGEEVGRVSSFIEEKLLIGTFGHMHSYSYYLVMMTLFVTGALKNKTIKGSWTFTVLIIASTVLIVFAGIRTPILALLIGILSLYFLKDRKKFVYILFFLAITGPIAINLIISNVDSSSGTGFHTPLYRIAELFTSFNKEAGGEEYVFVTRGIDTMSLIINSFMDAPLFGVSKGYILGENFNSPTDYYLFLIIVEFGIVGFVLLLSPVLFILMAFRKDIRVFSIAFPIFASLLVSTLAHHTINSMPHMLTISTIVVFLFSSLNKDLKDSTKIPN